MLPQRFWCKLIERQSWPICASGAICYFMLLALRSRWRTQFYP
jgi:hypothetical protein